MSEFHPQLAPRTASQSPVLCCIWGELRAVRSTAEDLALKVLAPLSADVAVCAQLQFDDDQERLEHLRSVFGSRLVYSELYQKPRPEDIFGLSVLEAASGRPGNWFNAGNSQVLANYHKLGEVLREHGFLSRYSVLVFTRSDLKHLVPFPGASDVLRALGEHDIITQAGHDFGGVNHNFMMLRASLASEFLSAPLRTIAGDTVPRSGRPLNIERFFRTVLAQNSWRNLRMPTTCFLTADTLGDRTTWNMIEESAERGGALFKYAAQLEDAHAACALWRSAPGWLAWAPPRSIQVMGHRGPSWRLFALALAAARPEHVERPSLAAAKDVCFEHDPRVGLSCARVDACPRVHLSTDTDPRAAARFDRALQGWRGKLLRAQGPPGASCSS